MPPAAPPTREGAGDYHYHVFDYSGSSRFKLSKGQPARDKAKFYSLYQDMRGLYEYGKYRRVPNIRLTRLGAVVGRSLVPGVALPSIMALSFGNIRNNKNAPTVLITGGIHAREWVAPEVAYLIAEYLIRNYTAKPANHYQSILQQLVDFRQIRIIPMLNPAGNSYTVFTPGDAARDWRKNLRPLPPGPSAWFAALTSPDVQGSVANAPFDGVWNDKNGTPARYGVPFYDPANKIPPGEASYTVRELANGQTGVDLNRNFPTAAWGYDTKFKDGSSAELWNPKSDAYFGPESLSEAETGQVADFAARLTSPLLSIDYHSYGEFIIFPGEYSDAGQRSADYTLLGEVLQALTVRNNKMYKLGTPMELVEYSTTGTIDDYLARSRGARGFTVELDGIYFTLPETDIQAVFERNIRGVLAAVAGGNGDSFMLRSARDEFSTWVVTDRGNELPDSGSARA